MTDHLSNRVFVVGAGGIGCALGYALRAGGIDVIFVEADPAKVCWGRSHGVGLDGHPLLPAKFVHFAEWQPPQEGVILLCTKCYDNKAVLNRLPSTVTVIPVQNGFDPDLIERSHIEGIASFVSECFPQKTHTRITRGGSLHIGHTALSEHRRESTSVELLIEVLRRHGHFRVRTVVEILPYKYAKLMYNSAISPLAAAAGLDNSQLLINRRARQLFFAMLSENYRILKDARVPLGKIGPFHPDTVNRILRFRALAWALAWPFSVSLRNTYCSMSGDVPKGRTEIDNYNGHLLHLAGDRPCPLNRRAYALLKRMESEALQPALERLEELIL
ncbi:MAG: ketopantoate reductase C-terminal domain-containing protein [Nitrospira sp.]|nr:ketopantoate reductase C-terminal domain-containing protein [Nitrospira sp.]